jgi:hypothetical protein
VLWNQTVHTDREVTANRPDITLQKRERENMHTDGLAIPADRNVVQKKAEKSYKTRQFL